MFTPLIARPEYRPLLRSALAGIVTVGAALLAVLTLVSTHLQLSGAYPIKSLLVFTAGALLLLRGLPGHHPFPRLGAGNLTTATRGALIALLAGLIGEPRAAPLAAVAAALALTITVLDGLDGRAARWSGMVSALGARFDMESDAVFVAVLSLLAWQFGKVGPWVLLSGLMRYLYAAAAALLPRLRAPVPSSGRGKSIAVIQMLALTVVLTPWCPRPICGWVAGAALGALTLSFALDVRRLLRFSPAAGDHAADGASTTRRASDQTCAPQT